MHVSESLDPVRSRLVENRHYIDCWLADMNDSLHLLDTLNDYLNNPEVEVSGDRLLALLRVALVSLSGGVDELSCILNLSEKAVTPTSKTPDILTPVTLDQFVAAPQNRVLGVCSGCVLDCVP